MRHVRFVITFWVRGFVTFKIVCQKTKQGALFLYSLVHGAVWPDRGGNAKSWRFGGPNVADFWEMSFGVFCHFQAQKGVFLGVFNFWQILPYVCFIFEENHSFSYIIFPCGALLFTCQLRFGILLKFFWLFFHESDPGFIDFISYFMLGIFEDYCRLKKAF